MTQEETYIWRRPEDEFIYSVFLDRFDYDGLPDDGKPTADRLVTGVDRTSPKFYHCGNLKGVIKRLDYFQSLGVTAILLSPIFKNKPVQGMAGSETAGYHGYWIISFLEVDPHFGTMEDFMTLVRLAHERGMKIYLDIVVSHTADVIRYRDTSDADRKFKEPGDYPFSTRHGSGGKPINGEYDPDQHTEDNSDKLQSMDFARDPYVPDEEKDIKQPAWLNCLCYYEVRGELTGCGEGVYRGEFYGLDHLMTNNPIVINGFIKIYGDWIDKCKVDGFRIDSAKHVQPCFLRKFLRATRERAEANRIKHFHIFGEVADGDVAKTAAATRASKLPSVIDFPLAYAISNTVAGNWGTDALTDLFAKDVLYRHSVRGTALTLPTFISNHDRGRFAWFVRQAFPQATDKEVLQRVILAYSMLFTMRGVPTVYYGDEQGFAGTGGDALAREDMYESEVDIYNNERLVGTDCSMKQARKFDESHPIFRAIQKLAKLRASEPALRRGIQNVLRSSDRPGLFAISRTDPETGREIIITYNTSTAPLTAQVPVKYRWNHFTKLCGDYECADKPTARGSYRVTLGPLGYCVCAAERLERPLVNRRNSGAPHQPAAEYAFA